MVDKTPLEDIELIRARRKETQKQAREEELRLQKIAQERRDSLDKERALRRSKANQLKQAKPKTKKAVLPRKNPIDLNDVINSIEQGIPFSAEDIAQKLNLNFSKGSPNRKFLADIFDELLTADIIQTDQKGRFIKPFEPDTGNVKKAKTKRTPQAQPAFQLSSEIKGVIHVVKGQVTFEPLDGETKAMNISSNMGMIDGSIVTAQLTDDFSDVANILDVHGNMEDDNALGKLSALASGIPLKFPDDILKDTPTLEIPLASPPHRNDLTNIPFITIDPIDAKDFDDAICVRQTTKGWKVMVAVADVSYYIKPGTALAKEAHKRGNSTYLPDMVIPMLPEELSNGVCSLRPNENRAAMVCTMDIDKQGNITSKKFERALVKSRMRLNYDEVQHAIDNNDYSHLPRNARGYVEKALEVYNARLKDKKRRGALEIDSAEQRVSIGKSRDVSLALEVGNEAHGIIEEIMITANVATAEVLQEKTDKTIKRVHGTPKEEIYNEFREQLEEIGIRAPKSGNLKNRILSIIGQIPHCSDPDLGYVLVTRMQDMAVYSTEDLEHFGLALPHYTHETSPIRRMTDLYVHYQLNEVLGLQGGYTLSSSMKNDMTKSADHFSRRERVSQAAERECQRRYMAFWVKRNLSNTFQGVVAAVNKNQLWVKVENEGVAIKTAIKKDDLPKPLYDYKGGDKIDLQPTKANTVTGIIEFKGVNPHP